MQSTTLRAVLFAVVCGLAVACGGDVLRDVREYTYPPDFQYLTEKEVQSTMGSLSAEINSLERVMQQPGGPQPADRRYVIDILTRIRTLSVELDSRAYSNHPKLREHGPRLQRDVSRALALAKEDPPNYNSAEQLADACSYCHAQRHDLETRPLP